MLTGSSFSKPFKVQKLKKKKQTQKTKKPKIQTTKKDFPKQKINETLKRPPHSE